MRRISYNGWTNYETWAVNLWLYNDEGYNYWLARAKELKAKNEKDALYNLAQELKDGVEDNAPKIEGLYSDLLTGALSEVNWFEIAESILEAI